jgi:hypothetical protein
VRKCGKRIFVRPVVQPEYDYAFHVRPNGPRVGAPLASSLEPFHVAVRAGVEPVV